MSKIAFIGLGHMGLPMACNLVKAGHEVIGFDLVPSALEQLVTAGGKAADSAREAIEGVQVVVSMLPASRHVEGLYLGSAGCHGGPGITFIPGYNAAHAVLADR